ncbi:MAG: PH domain-containing protein [Lachnospiraceae bacterium]
MYENLNKRAIGCMLANEILGGIVLTISIFLAKIFLTKYVPLLSWLSWVLLAVIWVLCLAAPFVRYRWYRYRFTEEEIDVREGFLFIKEEIVPIERLQKVALASGPIDRIFGLSKVIVTTAGDDVTIRFLEEEKAKKITEHLKNRINQYGIRARKQAQNEEY